MLAILAEASLVKTSFTRREKGLLSTKIMRIPVQSQVRVQSSCKETMLYMHLSRDKKSKMRRSTNFSSKMKLCAVMYQTIVRSLQPNRPILITLIEHLRVVQITSVAVMTQDMNSSISPTQVVEPHLGNPMQVWLPQSQINMPIQQIT